MENFPDSTFFLRMRKVFDSMSKTEMHCKDRNGCFLCLQAIVLLAHFSDFWTLLLKNNCLVFSIFDNFWDIRIYTINVLKVERIFSLFVIPLKESGACFCPGEEAFIVHRLLLVDCLESVLGEIIRKTRECWKYGRSKCREYTGCFGNDRVLHMAWFYKKVKTIRAVRSRNRCRKCPSALNSLLVTTLETRWPPLEK